MASVVAAWPTVTLGEVLQLDIDAIPIDAAGTYPIAGVYSFGRGLLTRQPLSGAETTYKVFHRLHTDQFVLSQLKAWEGALARVPESFDGWFLSPQFPTFRANNERLDIRFLDWYCKQSVVWENLRSSARGMGARRDSVSPSRFLNLQIPLPPLDEQRRIVARIEELAARIEQARRLRREAMEEAEALWQATLATVFTLGDETHSGVVAAELLEQQAVRYVSTERPNFNGAHPYAPNVYADGLFPIPSSWVWTDLGSVLTHFVDCVNDTPDFCSEATAFVGLKSTNIRPYRLDLTERWFVTREDYARWNRRATPQSGDLILTREAPMGNVCMLPDGVAVCLTQRLMLLRSDDDFVSSRYLLHFLNSSHFQSQVLEQCRGLTTPHVRVKDAPLFKVPLPPRHIQDNIVAYLDNEQAKMISAKQLQAETAAELDALLPSVLDKAFRGEL